MKLANRKSYLSSLPEGSAPESLFSKIVRWFYFLVLIALVVYFGHYFFEKWMKVKGFGQVVVEKVLLSAEFPGTITQLAIVEGQHVSAGQLLAVQNSVQNCRQSLDGGLMKIKYQIEMKRARLQALQQSFRQQSNQIKMYNALELNSRKLATANDMYFEIALLKRELAVQQAYLRSMEQQLNNQQPDPLCLDNQIVAPFDGVIKKVLKAEHEFADRADPIMAIEKKNSEVLIEGYLSKYELKNVSLEQEFSIIFPDDQTSKAKIDQIVTTANAFSERKWKDYEPIDTRIMVRLKPLNGEHAEMWKQYDLLRVRIKASLL